MATKGKREGLKPSLPLSKFVHSLAHFYSKGRIFPRLLLCCNHRQFSFFCFLAVRFMASSGSKPWFRVSFNLNKHKSPAFASLSLTLSLARFILNERKLGPRKGLEPNEEVSKGFLGLQREARERFSIKSFQFSPELFWGALSLHSLSNISHLKLKMIFCQFLFF